VKSIKINQYIYHVTNDKKIIIMFPFLYPFKVLSSTIPPPSYESSEYSASKTINTNAYEESELEPLHPFSLANLTPWSLHLSKSNQPPLTATSPAKQSDTLPVSYRPIFQIDPLLNNRIYLWHGDILTLQIDAIVNTTNEKLNDKDGLSGRILRYGRQELYQECIQCERCPTGDAVITSAPHLLTHHIIHAVTPRYTNAYANAADLTLHQCYKRSLLIAKENRCFSLAFPNLAVKKKGYPMEAATHVALRTLRFCLQHEIFECINSVVLALSTEDEMNIYEKLFPLYFPRTAEELELQQQYLPMETYETNEWGEHLISNRCVRVNASLTVRPDTQKVVTFEKDDIVPTDFYSWQDDPDTRRQKREESLPPEQRWEEQQQREYYAYLRLAVDEETIVPELNAHNFLYCCGEDDSGHPIIAIIGERIPASTIESERLMAYVIHSFHHFVQQPYSILYIHTNSSYSNQPYLSWLRKFYYVFLKYYKKNLVRFLLLHPSLLLNSLLYVVTPLLTRKAAQKVHTLSRLSELQNYGIQSALLKLPDSVRDYDQMMFGTHLVSKDEDENSAL
jgi:O-acetyl-ADP-ribose deacetylase (regulator of RNase III)